MNINWISQDLTNSISTVRFQYTKKNVIKYTDLLNCIKNARFNERLIQFRSA